MNLKKIVTIFALTILVFGPSTVLADTSGTYYVNIDKQMVTQRSREAIIFETSDIPDDLVDVTITFDLRYGQRGRANRASKCRLFVADAGLLGKGHVRCEITFAGSEQLIEWKNEEGEYRHMRVKDLLGKFDHASQANDLCRTIGLSVYVGGDEVCGRGKRQQSVAYSTRAERSLFTTGTGRR